MDGHWPTWRFLAALVRATARGLLLATMFGHAALAQQAADVHCPPKPLTEAQVSILIGAPPARIVQWVETCHISFIPSGDVLDRLKSKGATKAVLDALVRDHPVPAAVPAPAAAASTKVRPPGYEMKTRGRGSQPTPSDPPVGSSASSPVPQPGREANATAESPRTPSVVARSSRPGDARANPKDGLTYVWIPPGTFMMGCSPGDIECASDEKPAHQVTITRGFWMGRTPATQEAWQHVIGSNPSYFKEANRPVESVSWNEAANYCRAVDMRLPTEAEWEYAARAGTTGSRYGNLDTIAWYSSNSGGATHDVMQKVPNNWGLYDMLGNVWQWTGDWYQDKYSGNNETDPQGPASGQYRALRGGSWDGYPRVVRVSFRLGNVPEYSNILIGFRCVGN